LTFGAHWPFLVIQAQRIIWFFGESNIQEKQILRRYAGQE
jgi:hypothetical protein